jgi:hypothetical protein
MSYSLKLIQSLLKLSLATLGFLCLEACDPCRELADKMCDCNNSEAERLKCRNDLNLAKAQNFPESKEESKVCMEALNNCSCEDLMRGDYAKCGLYRNAKPKKNN